MHIFFMILFTEIHVRLPSNIRTSKHVSVLITPSKISISPKPNPNNETILAGMIEERYKYAEAMWTISSNGKLTISLGMRSNDPLQAIRQLKEYEFR